MALAVCLNSMIICYGKKTNTHYSKVVIAAGNNGNYGILTVSYPSVSIPAFSVGSVGNEYNHFDCYISATGVSHPIRKIHTLFFSLFA